MNTTAIRTELLWTKVYDKYSRPKVQLDRVHISENGTWTQRDRSLAIVLTLPKAYFETYGHRYLVNINNELTHFVKRAEAIRFAESQV